MHWRRQACRTVRCAQGACRVHALVTAIGSSGSSLPYDPVPCTRPGSSPTVTSRYFRGDSQRWPPAAARCARPDVRQVDRGTWADRALSRAGLRVAESPGQLTAPLVAAWLEEGVGERPGHQAHRPRRRIPDQHEARDRLSVPGDHHVLALLGLGQDLRQPGLRLLHVDLDRHRFSPAGQASLTNHGGPSQRSTQVSFAPPPRDELTIMLPLGAIRLSVAGSTSTWGCPAARDCSTNARRSTARGSSLPSA